MRIDEDEKCLFIFVGHFGNRLEKVEKINILFSFLFVYGDGLID